MSAIRALERDDLPAIVRLYEQIMRGGEPAPHLVDFFERTLLDQPWADRHRGGAVLTQHDLRHLHRHNR